MAAIAPFRHLIVYPVLIPSIGRRWQAATAELAGRQGPPNAPPKSVVDSVRRGGRLPPGPAAAPIAHAVPRNPIPPFHSGAKMTFPPAGRARLRPSSGFHPYDPAHHASRPPNGAETVRSGATPTSRHRRAVGLGRRRQEPGGGHLGGARDRQDVADPRGDRAGLQRGFSTLSGRAAEYEQDLPLAVFSEAISRALGAADLERLDLDEGNRAALASVLPFLGLSAAPPPRWTRARPSATTCCGRCTRCWSHWRPRTRWCWRSTTCTGPTRPRSTSCPGSCTTDRASVAAGCSPCAPARPRAAAQRAVGGRRHGQVAWLELQPLTSAESDALLKGVGNRALRRLIYSESGGNPLYLEQLAVTPKRAPRSARRRSWASRARSARSSGPRPRRSGDRPHAAAGRRGRRRPV